MTPRARSAGFRRRFRQSVPRREKDRFPDHRSTRSMTPTMLSSLCTMEPEQLFSQERRKLGLVGHLFREALIDGSRHHRRRDQSSARRHTHFTGAEPSLVR